MSDGLSPETGVIAPCSVNRRTGGEASSTARLSLRRLDHRHDARPNRIGEGGQASMRVDCVHLKKRGASPKRTPHASGGKLLNRICRHAARRRLFDPIAPINTRPASPADGDGTDTAAPVRSIGPRPRAVLYQLRARSHRPVPFYAVPATSLTWLSATCRLNGTWGRYRRLPRGQDHPSCFRSSWASPRAEEGFGSTICSLNGRGKWA